MKTILLLVIVGLLIYIYRLKKKSNSSSSNTTPKPTGYTTSSEPVKKNDFNLDIGSAENESGREYLEEYYDVSEVDIPSRKEYILNNCDEYDPVFLRKEPGNPVNNNAIAVYHKNDIIGYIPDDELDEVHRYFDNIADASISEIEYDGDSLRVEINVEHEITKRRKKPKTKKSVNEDTDLHPEDFMRFAQNKIPSEYLKPQKDLEDTGSFFYKKKVCISGSFDYYPYRAELAKYLWELGADVDTTVSKKCQVLICGEDAGPSKCQQAEEQGVHIMHEEELVEKLNGFKSKYV